MPPPRSRGPGLLVHDICHKNASMWRKLSVLWRNFRLYIDIVNFCQEIIFFDGKDCTFFVEKIEWQTVEKNYN